MQTDVIYLGDCVKVLGSLPDNSVAAVITDPPFNIGLKGYDVYKDKLTPRLLRLVVCFLAKGMP